MDDGSEFQREIVAGKMSNGMHLMMLGVEHRD